MLRFRRTGHTCLQAWFQALEVRIFLAAPAYHSGVSTLIEEMYAGFLFFVWTNVLQLYLSQYQIYITI
jgi:hypothetical protein